MARYFLHRFLLTLPALWLVLTMVFLLIHIVPGDPVEQMLGESAAPGQAAELRHTLGLDRPLIVQYGRYLWQVARGDFGQSFKFQAPVRRVIFERYPATLQLALLALLVCMAIAIPAGVLAAHRRGTAADRVVGVLAPIPSWGAMLNDARNHLFDAPHMVIFPALAVVLAVLAFNLLGGDAWRDWLDPRTRSQMAAVEHSR